MSDRTISIECLAPIVKELKRVLASNNLDIVTGLTAITMLLIELEKLMETKESGEALNWVEEIHTALIEGGYER